MTIDEMIAVLQAAKAGKVEWRSKPSGTTWFECSLESFAEYFNQPEYEFRVKPEPREWTVSACTLDHKADAYPRRYDDIITVREVL